jgi:hypothetical protein
MHPSRLRLGPSQSRPLTDASPGSARSPGLRVCRAAPSRRRNTHTHAPFPTECQSFLRCWDMRLTISQAAVGPRRCPHAAAVDGRSAHIAVIPQGVNPNGGCPRRPLGFVGEVEDLADVFDAVDIAWMSAARARCPLVPYCHRRRWSILAPFGLLAEPELGPNL